MKKTKMLEKDKNVKDKIKDVKNIFRLKKEMDDTTTGGVRSLLKLKKELNDTAIKD